MCCKRTILTKILVSEQQPQSFVGDACVGDVEDVFETVMEGEILDSTDDEAEEDSNEPPKTPGFDVHSHSINECLRYWALITNTPQTSINLLLHILRERANLPLPKDARTLMRTSTAPKNILNIAGGQYWYNGLGKCLQNIFR